MSDSNEFFEKSEVVSTAGQGESIDVDMDALHEQYVNDDEVRQTLADSLLPSGSFVTVPVLRRQVTRVKDSDRWSLVKPSAEGRLMIRLYGMVELTVTEKTAEILGQAPGSVIRGAMPLTVSPDRAYSVRDGEVSKKVDNTTKLWAQAVAAYREVYKTTVSEQVSIGSVVDLLENYPVRLQVRQFGVPTKNNPNPTGTPGNWIAGINAVREARE